MDLTIQPGKLRGTIQVIPSKSQAHRYLICAAFADQETRLICPETNRDMDATAHCLTAMGACIRKDSLGYTVTPIREVPVSGVLPCGESGSTLRFLLPVAGALGMDAAFFLEGRLPGRPLSPLWEEMERMGCRLSRPSQNTVRCQGRLKSGHYLIDGGVSSQFITGLLFAAALIPGKTRIELLGKVESKPYISMTLDALKTFGLDCHDLTLSGGSPLHSPGTLTVEGDFSNAAFFLAANALGSQLQVLGLNPHSCQGDRAIEALLPELDRFLTLPCGDIPDLVPILAVTAACKEGALFTDIHRLRLKESDRVQSVIAMLEALGGRAEATADTLRVFGTGLSGGTVDASGDHRIAMAAAIAATACTAPVTILGAQCVSKSYPGFFKEYRTAGGTYEQYIR